MTLEPIQYLLGALSGSLVGFTLGLVGGGGSLVPPPVVSLAQVRPATGTFSSCRM